MTGPGQAAGDRHQADRAAAGDHDALAGDLSTNADRVAHRLLQRGTSGVSPSLTQALVSG